MSTLKFSQFTELTSPATTTYMVGYDGTDNIRIEASELDTTYGLQLSSGGLTSVNLNLLGSDGSNSSIELIEGSNISLSFSGNTIAISATDTNTTNQTLSLGASPTYTLTLTDSDGGTVSTSLAALAGGGDKNFVFTQNVPSATWNITHNLGKYASVSIVDSAGTIVNGEVEYISINEVQVTFRSAFAGEAYLN